MDIFKFIDNPKSDISGLNDFVAHINNVKNEDELFDELYHQLKFPDYFGFNWNALYDCLRDFDWIDETNIILVHNSPLSIETDSFEIYIDVLYDAIKSWENDSTHKLIVIFPKSQEKIINSMLMNKR